MAPDLNSLPSSPRKLSASSQPNSPTASRRGSQVMSHTTDALDGALPSRQRRRSPNQAMLPPASPPRRTAGNYSADSPTVPLRHPRPLTAAEVHLAAEQEQEAIVNRLTRELSALRAQHSASAASNASSTSGVLIEPTDSNHVYSMSGSTRPIPARRHRSSSNLSTRSMSTPSMGVSIHSNGPVTGTTNNVPPVGSTSQAAMDRAREGGRAPSRQNSVHSQRHHSGTSSPHLSYHNPVDHQPLHSQLPSQPHRLSLSGYAGMGYHQHASPQITPSPTNSRSQSMSTRREETNQYKAELESTKAENESLKQRVRMLERSLRDARRESAAGPERSERDQQPN